MKYSLLLAGIFSFRPGLSQVLRSPVATQYIHTGAYSKNFTDAFSFTSNQACLSQVKKVSAGVYTERKFMLNELKKFSGVISFPIWSGGVGFTAEYAGFAGYNESHAGIAYGKTLGEHIDVGIQFNYYRISIAGYGSAAALNVEMGTVLHITEKLHAGCHIYNPVGGKFGKNSDEKLAAVYSFGMGYEASQKLLATAEIIKAEKQPVNINVSIQYAFIKQFFIRGGVSSVAGNYFAGAGFWWKTMRIDMAADWHRQAGLTPCLLLIFDLAKIKSVQE